VSHGGLYRIQRGQVVVEDDENVSTSNLVVLVHHSIGAFLEAPQVADTPSNKAADADSANQASFQLHITNHCGILWKTFPMPRCSDQGVSVHPSAW